MHYVDEGQGPPLLMVHGNPTWSFYWRRLIHAFRSDYRVIAVDHVGCGLSDKPQQYPYTLQQHIDNLVPSGLITGGLSGRHWWHTIGVVPSVWGRPWPNRSDFRPGSAQHGRVSTPFIPWRIRLCRIPWLGTWACGA